MPIPWATIDRSKVELTSNLCSSVLVATGQEFYLNPDTSQAPGTLYAP